MTNIIMMVAVYIFSPAVIITIWRKRSLHYFYLFSLFAYIVKDFTCEHKVNS